MRQRNEMKTKHMHFVLAMSVCELCWIRHRRLSCKHQKAYITNDPCTYRLASPSIQLNARAIHSFLLLFVCVSAILQFGSVRWRCFAYANDIAKYFDCVCVYSVLVGRTRALAMRYSSILHVHRVGAYTPIPVLPLAIICEFMRWCIGRPQKQRDFFLPLGLTFRLIGMFALLLLHREQAFGLMRRPLDPLGSTTRPTDASFFFSFVLLTRSLWARFYFNMWTLNNNNKKQKKIDFSLGRCNAANPMKSMNSLLRLPKATNFYSIFGCHLFGSMNAFSRLLQSGDCALCATTEIIIDAEWTHYYWERPLTAVPQRKIHKCEFVRCNLVDNFYVWCSVCIAADAKHICLNGSAHRAHSHCKFSIWKKKIGKIQQPAASRKKVYLLSCEQRQQLLCKITRFSIYVTRLRDVLFFVASSNSYSSVE